MRRIIASTVVTTAALVGVAFTALADTPGRSHRFRLIEHLDGVTFVDDPPAGDSVGDRLTFDDPLFDATNTRQVGKVLAVCTQVGTSLTLFHCDVTVAIADDSLALQGEFDAADDHVHIRGHGRHRPLHTSTRRGHPQRRPFRLPTKPSSTSVSPDGAREADR